MQRTKEILISTLMGVTGAMMTNIAQDVLHSARQVAAQGRALPHFLLACWRGRAKCFACPAQWPRGTVAHTTHYGRKPCYCRLPSHQLWFLQAIVDVTVSFGVLITVAYRFGKFGWHHPCFDQAHVFGDHSCVWLYLHKGFFQLTIPINDVAGEKIAGRLQSVV